MIASERIMRAVSRGGIPWQTTRGRARGKALSAFSTDHLRVLGEGCGMDSDRREYQRQYRIKNLERLRAKDREYQKTHRAEHREISRRYYAAHREKILRWHRKRRATPRGKEYVRRQGARWRAKNPDYLHAYYMAHRERFKEHSRRWRKRNAGRYRLLRQIDAVKRRAQKRMAGGRFTRGEWAEMKKRFSFCPGCGRTFSPKLPPTIDHIVPLSRGGRHEAANIQPLCLSCNSMKFNKPWAEFVSLLAQRKGGACGA